MFLLIFMIHPNNTAINTKITTVNKKKRRNKISYNNIKKIMWWLTVYIKIDKYSIHATKFTTCKCNQVTVQISIS